MDTGLKVLKFSPGIRDIWHRQRKITQIDSLFDVAEVYQRFPVADVFYLQGCLRLGFPYIWVNIVQVHILDSISLAV
jgi:hypothetical protein